MATACCSTPTGPATASRARSTSGSATAESRDLNNEDYTDLDFWKIVPETNLTPTDYSLTESDSYSVGGNIVLNDAKAAVDALVNSATLTADGAVTVEALEGATLNATVDSFAQSSGGSGFGSGASVAINGTIATNMVRGAASARITDSIVSSTNAGVTVNAVNSVSDAHIERAAAFEPERWLGQDTQSAKRIAMPFGAGPRICPGRYLALLEMKLAISALLTHFEISAVNAPGGGEAAEHLAFTMAPLGLRMTLKTTDV